MISKIRISKTFVNVSKYVNISKKFQGVFVASRLFSKYNPNDQVKEDEMGRACSTNGRRRGMHIGYWWENQKERDHWEDQEVGGWTILSLILER
jgi:hypothetical protein